MTIRVADIVESQDDPMLTDDQIADLRRWPAAVFKSFIGAITFDEWCEAQDRFDAVIAQLRKEAADGRR